MQRRLSTILAADVVEYSRLMEADEEATVRALNTCRKSIDSTISAHHGRIFGSAGDSVIAEFASPVEAMRCAVNIQNDLESAEREGPGSLRMQFRIGINLGDVIVDGDNLLGDGVNVAARLESIADPGRIALSRAVYDQVRKQLDLDYVDLGKQHLKNIEEKIQVYQVRPAATSESSGAGAIPNAGQDHGDKPSIVVLPFVNMSGDPEQEYFSEGITESIIIELSRFPTLFVIARHSSFNLKKDKANLQDVARELGVKYVAEGSIQKSGNKVRVGIKLSDAESGIQIWAERYDKTLDDIFEVQDEVAQSIVSSISGRVVKAELASSQRKPTSNLTAYDHFLRGNVHFYKLTREDNLKAREEFLEAINLDPSFARAYARLGATYNIDLYMGWNTQTESDLAMEHVQKGLAIDPEDSWVRETLGFVFLRNEQFEDAIEQFERVIELNPNDADSMAWTAHAFVLLGHSEDALKLIRKAMRLNPLHPDSYNWTLGSALYFIGEYDQSVQAFRKGKWVGGWRHLQLGAAYAQTGNFSEARAEIDTFLDNRRLELKNTGQATSVSDMELAMERVNKFANPKDRNRLIDGIRKAGISG